MARKLTLEIVKERLKKINKNIEILSDEYINSGEHLKCRCLIDRHEWSASWDNLKQGKGCPMCAGIPKLTMDIIKKRLLSKNPNIEILSDEYVNAHTKLKCRCLVDGCEWCVTWNNLQQGCGCPRCAGTEKLTLGMVKEIIKGINSDIEILSDNYLGSNEKLRCKCLIDGHIWTAKWDNLKQGKGCPECGLILSADKRRLSIDVVKKRYKKINPNAEIISEDYIGGEEMLKCRCLIDGHIWTTTWSGSLSQGCGCPVCGLASRADKRRFNIKMIKGKLEEKSPNVEIISNDYMNAKSKLNCRCLVDEYEWITTWDCLSRGQGCPKCNISKGEKEIGDVLVLYNLIHDIEFTFDDCRNVRPLPFDFAIFDNNKKLASLIEYDGEQHFEPVDFAGKGKEWAIKGFKEGQHRDNIKNKYCKDNNIPLLRIPYWEFKNIEAILDEWLVDLGLIERSDVILKDAV